ncbi:MAG: hypothetical protein ACQES2_12070 [Pseudomonadota bacterium]
MEVSAVKRQRGAILLILALVFLGMAGSLLLAAGASPDSSGRTTEALNEARMALMAYALQSHSSGVQMERVRLGELPCPDGDGDGRIDIVEDYAGSHCRYFVGWFPWRSLGTPPLVDESGSRLWYAVAAGWHNHASGSEPALYPGYTERVWLDGVAGVAWVGAPGEPGADQQRQPATDRVGEMAHYLELDKTGSRQWQPQEAGNDRFLLLEPEPLLAAVERRALAIMASWLNRFQKDYGHYPDAAESPGAVCKPGLVEGALPLSCPDARPLPWPDVDAFEAWVVRNRWVELMDYRRESIGRAHLQGHWHSVALAGGELE